MKKLIIQMIIAICMLVLLIYGFIQMKKEQVNNAITPQEEEEETTPAFTTDLYPQDISPDIQLEIKDKIIYIRGSVKNNSGKDLEYGQITYGLYDKDNNLIHTTIDMIVNLPKDDIWYFSTIGTDIDNKFHHYELIEIIGW